MGVALNRASGAIVVNFIRDIITCRFGSPKRVLLIMAHALLILCANCARSMGRSREIHLLPSSMN